MYFIIKMNHKHIIYIIAVLCTLFSCTDTRSRYVLDSDEMEDLLYDIHKSHFIQEYNDENRRNGAMQYVLLQNVLKQHGVTRAEYDSSIVYYTRNADELSKIYESLTDRLSFEASAMGAGVTEMADTSDVWSADRHILLINDDLNASYQWSLNTDTLLQPGEKVTLKFLGIFMNREAQRRATAVLVLRLKNDSVIVRHHVASQTGVHSLNLTDVNAEGIKSLSGMFVLHHPVMIKADSKRNELKDRQIFSISELKLLHEPKVTPKETSKNIDTSKVVKNDTLIPVPSDSMRIINEKAPIVLDKKTVVARPRMMSLD